MKKCLAGLLAVIVIAILGIVYAVATTDADTYRDQIATTLNKQIGRSVSLQGPITLGWSWHGVTLTIQNAAIGNPSWASRPTMTEIGRLNLGVAWIPLLFKQLVVTRLEIANADIHLETGVNGAGNWVMQPAESDGKKMPETKEAQAHASVVIHINGINIRDSRLGFKDKQGQAHIVDVKKLTIGAQDFGNAFRFDGTYNGMPLVLNLDAGVKDLLAPTGGGTFAADLICANYKLKFKGHASLDKNQVEIDSYEVTAGHSHFRGQLAIDWGTHPEVNGTLIGERLDIHDFSSGRTQPAAESSSAPQPSDTLKRLFSDEPLGFEVLKSYNADLSFKIDELVMTGGALNQVIGKIGLTNGILSVSPFKAMLGKGEIEGQGTIDAADAPPQMAALIKAPDIRLEDALALLGAPGFLSGRANANINLASSGNTAHALAANAVGIINIVAGNGKISSSAAADIATSLMSLFAPGASNDLNCLAARFIIKNGIGRDNGILVDTGAATISGKGGFDLGHEVISMDLYAKAKQISVAGLMPPLRVRGTFTEPSFSIDPVESVQKVAGIFSGSSLDNGVPDIINQPGQNACLYTLDHPSAGTTSTTILPAGITGKIGAGLNAIKSFFQQQ